MHWGGLFGVFEKKKPEANRDGGVILAQATDPRVTQIEEQIRSLNGKIEELNFQILQMQEQMRKTQEDYEFRLQEIENKKKSDAGGKATRDTAANTSGDGRSKAAGAQTDDVGQAIAAGQASPPQDNTAAASDPAENGAAVASGDAAGDGKGAPPRDFGTITVDKDGNVVTTTADQPVDLLPPKQAKQEKDGINVAALPKTNDSEELYRNSYQSILSGDYAAAEGGFRDYIARFPKDTKIADSNYWLGEALLGQKKYRDAAEVFLAASKSYPKSKKGPDMLLKLGVSLVGLNQKDVACATFLEVGKRYPDASDALKQRVKQEQAFAAC